MIAASKQKITKNHLKRNAYLYVRQSTVRQVLEHQESTQRQYALRQQAQMLGWPSERVVVIDEDLGLSGTSATNREGFQYLVAEVGIGRAGVVLGLEVSRLARNNADWHRLLEICALTETLILDEDGLYDPCDFNDRLLLGLKGTMSEAELHVLRARMRGGVLSKARRGELKVALPVGLVYKGDGQVARDPDKQVQECLCLFFEAYRRTGSARSIVKHFRKQGILFPRRLRLRERKGELVWTLLDTSRALDVLHNPRYAGAFAYGRKRSRKYGDGRVGCVNMPREEWHTLIRDAHEGYISWEEYENNQRQLRQTAQARGGLDGRTTPPREGPALLQGLALCGVCGKRMSIHYHHRHGRKIPNYTCARDQRQSGVGMCQFVPGEDVDRAIEQLLLKAVTPMALEVALNVQQELQRRLEETDNLRRQQVERAQYEVNLARRRFMQVDPDNRLVAENLETEWNEKLRTLEKVRQEYDRRRQADRLVIDDQKRAEILSLATDFPRLWRSRRTSNLERKRMIRLLIEDVTLIKGKEIGVNVRFKGGATETLSVPKPELVWKRHQTDEELIKRIDRLLDHHTDAETAAILHEEGFRSGTGLPLRAARIKYIRTKYGLRSRRDRLRQAGKLTLGEIAHALDVTTTTVKIWQRRGLVRGHQFNDKNECLFEPPGENGPTKSQGMKRLGFHKLVSDHTQEVQYEA